MVEKTNLEILEELTNYLAMKDALIRRSEIRLKTALDLAPLGMFLVTHRIIRWVNKKLCEITGYTASELKDQSTRILYESDEEYVRVGKAVYCGMPECSTRTKIRKKNGDLLLCTLHVVVVDVCDNDAVVATYIDDIKGY